MITSDTQSNIRKTISNISVKTQSPKVQKNRDRLLLLTLKILETEEPYLSNYPLEKRNSLVPRRPVLLVRLYKKLKPHQLLMGFVILYQ